MKDRYWALPYQHIIFQQCLVCFVIVAIVLLTDSCAAPGPASSASDAPTESPTETSAESAADTPIEVPTDAPTESPTKPDTEPETVDMARYLEELRNADADYEAACAAIRLKYKDKTDSILHDQSVLRDFISEIEKEYKTHMAEKDEELSKINLQLSRNEKLEQDPQRRASVEKELKNRSKQISDSYREYENAYKSLRDAYTADLEQTYSALGSIDSLQEAELADAYTDHMKIIDLINRAYGMN